MVEWAGRLGHRALMVDVASALVLAGVGVVTSVGPWTWQGAAYKVDGLGLALIVGAALALVARRVWPLATLLVTTGAVSTYLALRYPYGMILLSLVVAVYTVAARLPARPATFGFVVAVAGLLVHVLAGLTGPGGFAALAGLAPAVAWVVVPFAVGWVVRIGRESAARARAEEVRRHSYEERLRIAREVHDVVGNGLSAINMQAEIALHVLAKQPEQVQTALTTIARTSKLALDELRATLDVVRRDHDSTAPRTPEPGLAALDELVARMADTGIAVTVTLAGKRGDVPAAVDLAAYRIVQEALTNVLRHADCAAAAVSVRYQPNELVVEVTDSVRGPGRTSGGGHGIAGMAARVTALGGTFETGPRPEGGFRVLARLPVPQVYR